MGQAGGGGAPTNLPLIAPFYRFYLVFIGWRQMYKYLLVSTGFFLFKLDSDKQLVTEFYWLFFDGRFLLDSDGS